MYMDFVVCVPTYNRTDVFLTHTYYTLECNKMTDNLYIWVVNQEQKELYEKALEGKTYKAILIRPEPELYKCYKTVSDYFPEGQAILWMEDKTRMYSLESKEDINLNY